MIHSLPPSLPTAFTPPLAGPRSDDLYEIIDGEEVTTPPMSTLSQVVANRIIRQLDRFAFTSDRGAAYVEVLFRLTSKRIRRPDGVYLSHDRWPKDRPIPTEGTAWDVIPDIAIEVVSPSDLADEVQEKLEDYFSAGVRQAWLVYPRWRRIYVYDSPLTLRGVGSGDTLIAGDVLPGFQVAVDDLFPPMLETREPSREE